MANVNLHVLCFLGLSLENDVPDHSVLSLFRTKLTKVQAWDDLLAEINRQIEGRNHMVKSGCHMDASTTHSPRKPKTKATYEIVSDREERDDQADAHADMRVVEVAQPGVDSEARWLKKAGKPTFGYKQYNVVDGNGLVIAVETTPANLHDTQPLAGLIDKAGIGSGDLEGTGTQERHSGQGLQEQAAQPTPACP